MLAYFIPGVIYAFNVGEVPNVANMSHEVPIKHHNVIYNMFDDLLETLSSRVPPLEVEEIVGKYTLIFVSPVIIPPANKVCRGVYSFHHSICPSMIPSVCASVHISVNILRQSFV